VGAVRQVHLDPGPGVAGCDRVGRNTVAVPARHAATLLDPVSRREVTAYRLSRSAAARSSTSSKR
jgi:hypothetical protein